MGTRLEIFRGGLWYALKLSKIDEIKYNAIINKIGKPSTREISHTNTFSLPVIYENTKALDINVFNAKSLARALNTRYVARYYVQDKLLQKGFLVINNTRGSINVNFINEALSIVEKWGSITFSELVTSKTLNIPTDYKAAIAEMTDYNMSKLTILTPLTNVGTRGYNLALFPNNLNAIGDKFQVNVDDVRVDDAFNPFQSRPVFNVKAVFDLACETYGFTALFDPTVDWIKVAQTYIIDSKVNENQRDDGNLKTIIGDLSSFAFPYYFNEEISTGSFEIKTIFNHPFSGGSTTSISPSEVEGWVNPPGFEDESTSTPLASYIYAPCIYIPSINESTVGTLHYTADKTFSFNGLFTIFSAWKNSTPGGDVVFKSISILTDNSTNDLIDIIIDKTQLNSPPVGSSGELIGIIAQDKISGSGVAPDPDQPFLENLKVIETYIPAGRIAFDDNGQYISNTITLTHAAPRENLKELISSYMHKEGILMDIDSNQKVIKFFSYGSYEDKRTLGKFKNWSKYYIKKQDPNYNTNYGNSYAKINRISLSSPYVGNTYDLKITNQGTISKYKDFTTNSVKKYKDVSKVKSISNTNTPYFEYENKGTGLVEETGNLGALDQVAADLSNQGSFTGLSALSNVNYGILPNGILEWYKLVDQAVRTEAQFLLPVFEIKEIDLTWPIYIEGLGGFWIIEEISEYTNSKSVVNVKLIKLIDNLKESDFIPEIDTTPPTIGILSIDQVVTTIDSITLNWTSATDNILVTGYRVFKDDVEIVTLNNVLEVTIGNLVEGQDYNFEIEARDFEGNWSSRSNLVVGTPADITAPTVPLLLNTGNITYNSIELIWEESIDDVGVVNYEIWQNGSLLITVGNITSHIVTGFNSYEFASFKIRAVDSAGNLSEFSNEETFRTLDVTEPVVGILSSTGETSETIDLSWTQATDNAFVAGYEIWQDSVLIRTIGTALNYTVTGLTFLTSYDFQIKAFDSTGNRSVFSNTLNVSTTNAPLVVLFQIASVEFALPSDSCSFSGAGVINKYKTGSNFPMIGDVIYNENPASTRFDGYTGYFLFDQSITVRIDSQGEIIDVIHCADI